MPLGIGVGDVKFEETSQHEHSASRHMKEEAKVVCM